MEVCYEKKNDLYGCICCSSIGSKPFHDRDGQCPNTPPQEMQRLNHSI